MTSEIDKKIDCFVKAINSSKKEKIFDTDLALSVRLGEPNSHHLCDWEIKPCNMLPCISKIESRINQTLPMHYRSFVTRYIFPSFEANRILIHGNTLEGTDQFEFRKRLFLDHILANTLLENGFLQFGRVDEVNYDPICFYYIKETNRIGEYSVVQLDHERILQNQSIVIVKVIAKDFLSFLKEDLEFRG